MTVQTPQSYQDYVGDGVTTQFVIPFPFLDTASHIHVYDIDLGFEGKIEYVQGSEYTVIGIPGNPNVQFVVAPPTGKLIHIRRAIPITQLLDYLATGVFPAESHESGLDKLTMICQDLATIIDLGDVEFGDFMKKGPHPVLDGLSWQGQALEITGLLPGTEGDSAATVAQLNAAVSGGVPATISGQTALYFSGDGSTVTYPLSGIQAIDADDINVYISGVHQSAHAVTGAYTVDNTGNPQADTTMTFGVAPPQGTDNIMVVFPSGAVSVTVSAGSVNSAAIIDGSVGLPELAPGSLAGQFFVWNGSTWTLQIPTSANISNFQAAVNATPLNSLAVATGSINAGNQKIINLATGSAATDAANTGQLVGLKKSLTGTIASTWWNTGAAINCGFVPGHITITFNFGYGGAALQDNAGSVSVAFATDRTWRVMYIAQDPDGGLDEERFIPVSFVRSGNFITVIGDPATAPSVNMGVTHYHVTQA